MADASAPVSIPLPATEEQLGQVTFNDDGLVPAIIQEEHTGRILMMAWMNADSIRDSLETGKTHFWSRSRQKYWMKGESSGHTQVVKDFAYDCDADTLLIQVTQEGSACHKGYKSCFFTSVKEGESKITEDQLFDPDEVYGKS